MDNRECDHFDGIDAFCLKDIASGRVWDCTANKKQRMAQLEKCKFDSLSMDINCPYPKLGKD